MNFAPIFSKIVDSSIWAESDLVVKIFVTMLAKQERDNVVRGNAYQIGKWANKSEAEALEALNVLSSPDTKRLEPQPFEGKRIEKVEDGWLILNGKRYQDEMRKIFHRAAQARAMQEKRAKEKMEAEMAKRRLTSGQPLSGEGLREQVSGDAVVAESLEARKEVGDEDMEANG